MSSGILQRSPNIYRNAEVYIVTIALLANIILSVFFWGAVLLIGLRALWESGLIPEKIAGKLKNLGFVRLSGTETYEFDRRTGIKIVLYGFMWRALAFVITVMVLRTFTDGDLSFTNYFRAFIKSDAKHYMALAETGYSLAEDGKPIFLVFFPLYPWLIRVLNLYIGSSYVSALIISTSCYLAAMVYLYKLVIIDYDKETAKRTLIYASIFPFAFFFGAPFTESLFLLTTVAAFYYMRRRKWFLVFVSGALATLTKVQGILIILPAIIEFCVSEKIFFPNAVNSDGRGSLLYSPGGLTDPGLAGADKSPVRFFGRSYFKQLLKGLWIPLILIGLLIYLYLNYKYGGNPFAFMTFQRERWFHNPVYFGKSISEIVKYIFSEWDTLATAIWIPELIVFIIGLVALWKGYKRHRSSYLAYLAAYMMSSFSVSWLISGQRYMTVMFPIHIVFASDIGKDKKWNAVFIAVSSAFYALYLAAFVMGKNIW